MIVQYRGTIVEEVGEEMEEGDSTYCVLEAYDSTLVKIGHIFMVCTFGNLSENLMEAL